MTKIIERKVTKERNDDDDALSNISSSSSGLWGEIEGGLGGERGGRRGKKTSHAAIKRTTKDQLPAIQTSFLKSPTEELIDQLASLGFDVPTEFVATHSPDRIHQAIARATSLPNVNNLPGLIRHLVTKPGPIPAPYQPPAPKLSKDNSDKYTKGKYSHLIRR